MRNERFIGNIKELLSVVEETKQKNGRIKESDALRWLRILGQFQNEEKTTEKDYEGNMLEAELLVTLATSRESRIGKIDHLTRSWIERAIKLDTNNHQASRIKARAVINDLAQVIEGLDYPALRETDYKQAKKKTAEDYVQISGSFLDHEQSVKHQIAEGLSAAKTVGDQQLISVYAELNAIYEELISHISKLSQSTTLYLDSLKGVFYTSNFLDEMKTTISVIRETRDKWDSLIKSYQPENQQKKVEKEKSCLTELDQMIGMDTVKRKVYNLYHYLQYQKKRSELGFTFKDEVSLNMILTGNPGTGKTTLARLLAQIYHELGILPKANVTEVDRSQLVGAYVGQTEENTMSVIKQAVGGVLFIDEAYSLKREGQSGNDYGQAAIDTLVSAMTSGEYAGKFAVILAGYPEEMRQFLWGNPGLRSRFPESNHIHLPDYSTEELLEIAEKVAIENDYTLTDEALIELEKRIDKERVDETFGNARTVKDIILDAIFQKGASYTEGEEDIVDFTVIDKQDLANEQQENPFKSAIEELDELVGLTAIKEEVKSLSSFVKMQQVRREKGLPVVPVQLHSVFSGNPGTGKTSVAKVFANILRETGLLKRGHLVITSRADFVAGYVGQTAIKTKKKIKEALGGVLFIDEAYSLLSSGQNDFGKEAIDTLVDEMTKHNENLVVILSGYPDEMEKLLAMNPGLKSRFKKFFHFPDYTTDELVQMATMYASRYGYQLHPEAISAIELNLTTTKVRGNGRYIANMMDGAIQEQAYRIMSETMEAQDSKEELSLIKKSDIDSYIKKQQ